MSGHFYRFRAARAKTIAASAAIAAALSSPSQAFDVRVEGLSGEPQENVEAMLTPVRERTSTQQPQTYRAQVDKSIRRGLEALGYYQYEIRYRWEKPKKEEAQRQDGAQEKDKVDKTPDKKKALESLNLAAVVAGTSPFVKDQTDLSDAVPVKTIIAGDVRFQRPLPGSPQDEALRQTRLDGSQRGKGPVLVATVKLGDPVLIKKAVLTIEGEDLTEHSVFRHLQRQLPKEGTQLNHGQYSDFKSSVERTAMRYGYFDGQFSESELQVNAETNEADWLLVFDPKGRYAFGGVSFEGSQIREPILRNIVPFKKGEPYSSDGIAELNRRLAATGWFNSIVVTPDIQAGRKSENKELPVSARVSPKTKNSIETGLGYSTDVGPRGKLIWKKPWINDSGHSLESDADISGLEQLWDMSYKMPLEENALEQYWLFRGGYKHEDLNDTKSDALSFAATRRWDLYEGWQKGVSLKWRLDDFTQGSVDNKTMMIYPEFSLSRSRSRGGLMPRWGDSQRYTVGYANKMWGSDVDALMLEAQFVLIRTYARNHRFVLRSHLGWIETGDFNDVPPDLRYFAGGDRSIRGYDYESISPKDENGELTGATKMLTGSFEYQMRVMGKWWGAVFVDVGRAANNFEFSDMKKGVGVGVRWESPLGPVKLDIATPVDDSEENGIQFYIGLGPEL